MADADAVFVHHFADLMRTHRDYVTQPDRLICSKGGCIRRTEQMHQTRLRIFENTTTESTQNCEEPRLLVGPS